MKEIDFLIKRKKIVDGANRTPNLTNSMYFSRTLSPIELHRLEPLFNSRLMPRENSMSRKSNTFILEKFNMEFYL